MKEKKKTREVNLDNDGLTVVLNFWPLKKFVGRFDPRQARLFLEGQATLVSAHPKEKPEIFHGPGELLTILGRWNGKKFKKFQHEAQDKKRAKPATEGKTEVKP